MKRIFLAIVILLFPLFFIVFANLALAATDSNTRCTGGLTGVNLSFDFTPPLTNDKSAITVTIAHEGNLPDGSYSLKVSDSSDRTQRGWTGRLYDSEVINGENLVFSSVTVNGNNFDTGLARVTLMSLESAGSAQIRNALCSEEFEVITPESTSNPSGSSCRLVFNTDFKPNSGIFFHVEDLQGEGNAKRGMVLTKTNENGGAGSDLRNICDTNARLSDPNGIGFPNPNQNRWPAGYYKVSLTERCSAFDTADGPLICGSPFLINVATESGGIIAEGENVNKIPGYNAPGNLNPPCSDLTDKGLCKSIKTPFGSIDTDAAGFIRKVLGIILTFAGAIVVLLIIISGYRLMTSQGNPERVQAAREQLTSAIVGLLFIIFSLVILQVITRDIIGLPGFG